MKTFEIQCYYQLDAMINFGYEDYTFKQYIDMLAEQYEGTDIVYPKEGEYVKQPTIMITFENDTNAQKFFDELYEKLTPRMFYGLPSGETVSVATTNRYSGKPLVDM